MTARGRPAHSRLWTALELAAYLAGCLLVTRGTWGRAVGDGMDLWGTLWFHEWIAHCLRNGVDPGWTSWFYHPEGLDLFAIMGNNYLDFVLAMPARVLLPSPHHMAPTTVLLLLGNALAMRSLLRSLGLSRIAVAAGALAFALNPYFLFEINSGRTAQALVWFWPLALRQLLLMERRPRWWRPVLAGLLLALQGWAYWFSGYFFVVALAPALLLRGWRRGRDWWLRLALAAAVCLVAVAPGVWPMLSRALSGGVPGLSHGMDAFDIHGLRSTLHGWQLLAPASSSLTIPISHGLVALLALALCRRRRLWLVSAALGLLLAAGPLLDLRAGQLTNPVWWLAEHALPGFERLLYPYRAWCVVALVVPVALAEAMDRWLPRQLHRGLALVPLLLLATAAPGPGLPALRSVPVTRPAYVDAVRRAPGVVFNLPFPCTQDHLHYQPMHGQPLVGGMGVAVAALRPPGLMQRLRKDPLSDTLLNIGVGLNAGPAPPARSGKRPYRWVVMHKKIYLDSAAMDGCWQGKPGVDRVARVRHRLQELLGPPHVEDRLAAAWMLK